MTENRGRGIAVVGLGALFPGSSDRHGFWRDILAGTDLISDVPPSHWLIEDYYDPDPSAPDRTYGKRGGFLDPVDFDPLEFAMPPSILPSTDTSQILALIVAKQVLDDATRGQFANMSRDRVSVILGVASTTELVVELGSRLQRPIWVKALREEGLPEDQVQMICDRIASSYVPWTESSFPGLLGNVVAGRIANRFDLGGTNCVIDAACASSLSALNLALLELDAGSSDLVIAGGVDTLNDILMYTCFSKTPALSETGDCRPFSDRADGTILGEGVGMIALKRLEDAERDGDRIYAVVRGLGASSDGKSRSVYAPVPEGQAKAIRRAYERAGYGPETVELIEAHGTATRAGDAAEFEGLRSVFDDGSGRQQRCALGSIKSQIGHTKAAAGAAGLFKAIMALHHRVLPPSIKVDRPNPALDLPNSPFYLNTVARPWIADAALPRRASVSSFGFGGSNYHVALEEYTGPAPRPKRTRGFDSELVLLDAGSPAELARECRSLAASVTTPDALSFVAYRSQLRREQRGPHRLAVVADSVERLRTLLGQAADRLESGVGTDFALPGGVYHGVVSSAPEVAFLFPGQGSQRLNMGGGLAMAFDTARRAWDEAAAVPMGEAEERLHDVVFPIPAFTDEEREARAARLVSTEWAQPALAAVSLSYLDLLRQAGVEVGRLGGHSFGELTALCAAGSLSRTDLFRVARKRGELMAAAAGVPGAMLAVSGELGNLQARVAEAGIDVVVANDNGPNQLVFSGTGAEIEKLEKYLEGVQGVSLVRLPVSTAFHSPLVAPSVAPFREFLDEIGIAPPAAAVFSNVSAAPYPHEPEAMREAIANQLAQRVRFAEEVLAIHEAGTRVFVEVGPGQALTGMVERILGDRPHLAVSMERRGLSAEAGLWHALGRLYAAGVEVDPAALWEEYETPVDPASVAKPRLAVPISGANYGKPYPPPGGAAELPLPNPPRPVEAAGVGADRDEVREQAEVRQKERGAPVSIASDPPTESRTAPVDARSAASGSGSPASSSIVPDGAAGWRERAILEMHRETAAAHSLYLSMMAESHTAYLRAMSQAIPGAAVEFDAPRTGEVHRLDPVSAPARVTESAPLPLVVPAGPRTNGVAHSAPPAPAERPARMRSDAAAAPSSPPRFTAAPEPVATSPAPVPQAVAAPVQPATPDLSATLLAIVSEKTGYPVEMLDPTLELESGLGIDSIKRVEILSALRETVPGLPEVSPSQLAALNTLADVLGFMEANGGVAVHPVPAAVSGSSADRNPAPSPTAPPAGPAVDLSPILLAIVSEKTGYPVEMLDPTLELESGLGIDSIKRVEILSALRETVPGLPEVSPSQLAALNTLADVLGFMEANGANGGPGGQLAHAPAPASTADTTPSRGSEPTTPVPLPTSAASVDLPGILLEIVAEKTGYPAEMLDLSLELESGLGIDSIKRVEILSALRDRVPDLPEVQPSQLASLRTLDEIIRFMDSGASAGEIQSPAVASIANNNGSAPEAGFSPDSSLPTAEVARYGLRLAAVAAGGFAMPRLLDGTGPIVVTDDGRGIASALVERLATRGINAALATTLPAEDAAGLIDLSGLREIGDIGHAIEVNREAFTSARAIARRLTGEGGVYVTVQDTGGDFGMSGSAGARAWSAGMTGLAKTAAREWPLASVKAIDIAADGRAAEEIADALAAELLAGGPELEVGLASPLGRVTPVSEEVREPGGDWCLEAGDVLVATGGGRGITAICLHALAERFQPRIAILGRTPLATEDPELAAAKDEGSVRSLLIGRARAAGRKTTPAEIGRDVARVMASREVAETIRLLEDAGSPVIYLSADVGDAESLGSALAGIRAEWGPVRALVHGAGVIADRRIEEKTDEQFDRVFASKVGGLRALLDATRNDPLRAILLFASVAGRTGNPGQADYAMANEILNRVAAVEAARRPGCLVRSLGWGPWDGGMVTPSLKAHFEKLGLPLIPPGPGATAFVNEFRADGATEVVLGCASPERALDGSAGRSWTMDVHVDAQAYPALESHSIRDVPVLPVVLVVEWLVRAAVACRPGLGLPRIEDLRVLKGVPLEGFGEAGDRLRVRVEEVPGEGHPVLRMELRGAKDILHYSARADFNGHGNGNGNGNGKANGNGRAVTPTADLALERWDWAPEELYDGRLFLGPDFQAIRGLDGVSAEAAAARLAGLRSLGWAEGDGWRTDLVALDGGLQLARLWGLHHLGHPSLPTRIGSVTLYSDRPIDGPIRCTLTSGALGELKTVSNISLVGEDGERIAELHDVEMHLLPGEVVAR